MEVPFGLVTRKQLSDASGEWCRILECVPGEWDHIREYNIEPNRSPTYREFRAIVWSSKSGWWANLLCRLTADGISINMDRSAQDPEELLLALPEEARRTMLGDIKACVGCKRYICDCLGVIARNCAQPISETDDTNLSIEELFDEDDDGFDPLHWN